MLKMLPDEPTRVSAVCIKGGAAGRAHDSRKPLPTKAVVRADRVRFATSSFGSLRAWELHAELQEPHFDADSHVGAAR